MKNRNDIERYEALAALRENYKGLYKEIEARYAICSCFHCKMKLISIGMEIVSLNSIIEHLESKMLPSLPDILGSMSIAYTVEDGRTKLVTNHPI